MNALKRFSNLLKNAIYRPRVWSLRGVDPATDAYWVRQLFGGGRVETDSGIYVDRNTAMTLSAVWNAVNIIAGAVGYLPLILYRETEQGRERATDSPLFRLLHLRPNPCMDALTFKECIQADVLLSGNGYAEIERTNRGDVIALWPLPSDSVRPELTNGQIHYRVKLRDGGETTLPAENIIHIKGLSGDGVRGYSVIECAANSLGMGLAVGKYAGKFYKQGVVPSGVFETDGVLSDKAYQQLKEAIKEEYAGAERAHSALVLQHGLKWRQTAMTPVVTQFISSYHLAVEDVARWFDLPPHFLKDLTRSTYSNIEHQALEFVTWTLTRWLRRWELELTYKLANPTGDSDLFVEFLLDSLLRGDAETRYRVYQIGIMSGILSVNEARRAENRNSIGPAGDVHLSPLNMQPVGGGTGQSQAIKPEQKQEQQQ